MSTIGTFTSSKEGGWSGTIHTLTMNVKIRLVPNDNRDNETAPAFRVFVGKSRVAPRVAVESGEVGKHRPDAGPEQISWLSEKPRYPAAGIFECASVDGNREGHVRNLGRNLEPLE